VNPHLNSDQSFILNHTITIYSLSDIKNVQIFSITDLFSQKQFL
jgi:hypothetical protein